VAPQTSHAGGKGQSGKYDFPDKDEVSQNFVGAAFSPACQMPERKDAASSRDHESSFTTAVPEESHADTKGSAS
jgi:hypothetical protein